MGLTPISGTIQAQPLNDNFSYLDSKINTNVINAKFPPAGLIACVANGITDDTVAAQAFVDYAHTNKITAFFPSGTYKFTNSLNITGVTQIICHSDCIFDFSGSPNDGVVLLPGYHTGRMIFGTIQNAVNGSGILFNGAQLAYVWFNFITGCKDNILLSTDAINFHCQDNTIEGMILSNASGYAIKLVGAVGVMQGNIFNINFVAGCSYLAFDALSAVGTAWSANIFNVPSVDGLNVVGSTGIVLLNSGGGAGVPGNTFLSQTFFGAFNSSWINIPNAGQCNFELAFASIPISGNITITGIGTRLVDAISMAVPPYSATPIAATTASNTHATWNAGSLVTARRTHLSITIPGGGLSAGNTADFYMYHACLTKQTNGISAFPRWSVPMVITAIEDESLVAGVDGNSGIANQIHIRVMAINAVPGATYNLDVVVEG